MKKILAISGGPDSMFMLNWYKKNKNIIVAHVNYHLRSDSNNDQKIVEIFCKNNNIKYEVLDVKEKPKGNIEAWARDVRYSFFKEIILKYNAKEVLIAHHKDDFLETAIMQSNSKRTPRYFGIKKKTIINEIQIRRPFINLFWKDEILKSLLKEKIKFTVDSTNEDQTFSRNKVRAEISKWTLKEKKSHLSWYKMSNKILKKKFKRVDKKFLNWKNSNWNIKEFRKIKKDKEEIVFEYVHSMVESVLLSKGKIKSLIDYIESSNGGKKFILNDFNYIYKKNNILLINKTA